MNTKIALITGASRGLGRTIALTLARHGFTIIVNYLSAQDKAEEVARTAGGSSCTIRADVGDSEQVTALAAEIEDRFGQLDVLVNNAGITADNILLRQTEEEWDRVIKTNLTGCFLITRSLSPLMIKTGGGHIINIASHSGIKGKAGQPAYSASKAGIIGLTLSSAEELAEYSIRVNAVMPGYLPTDMGSLSERAMNEARAKSLLKCLSSDQETADFIAYLVTTAHITGQVFSLDSRLF
ncbi:MAG: beta-ketoacyl-ACP reductase [Thermodesulfovibrio sp.]|nr:beta-ketoacyl-ACP reductase [Thermodesulfovibrio sp.]